MEFTQSDLDEAGSNQNEKSQENPFATQAKKKTQRKKAHHYTDADDISLLMEILQEKPTRKGAAEKWRSIYTRVKIPVKDYKAIQARFDVLLSTFKQDEKTAFRG